MYNNATYLHYDYAVTDLQAGLSDQCYVLGKVSLHYYCLYTVGKSVRSLLDCHNILFYHR